MKNITRLLFLLFFCWGNMAYAAQFEATIELAPRFELSLPVSGVIDTLHVRVGQRVAKGDAILTLDPLPFNTAKTNAKARVTVQQTLLTESKRDLQQQQELYDRTVLSLVELENAQLREKRDRAGLEHAEAQLADADYALSYSKLLAPFDALILAVYINQGQSINNTMQSKTLVSLVRQNHYQASFYVPVTTLAKLKIDQPVIIKSMGQQYQGRISSINYQPVASHSTNDSARVKQFIIAAEFVSSQTSAQQTMLVGNAASVDID